MGRIGGILLGIWLVLTGLMMVISIPIPVIVMAILAIVAGALLLFGK